MTIQRTVDPGGFINQGFAGPYGLKNRDFQNAIESLYEFLFDINSSLEKRNLEWMEQLVGAAAISSMFSDLAAAALAKHSNGLVVNMHHNGHPDLVPRGMYPNDDVAAGIDGVEIKSTRRTTADTHGARNGWFCQFNYKVDKNPLIAQRQPTMVTHVYLAQVKASDFRLNGRKTAIGTRTATLHAQGLVKLRAGLVYKDPSVK
jgi:hypothetical protein